MVSDLQQQHGPLVNQESRRGEAMEILRRNLVTNVKIDTQSLQTYGQTRNKTNNLNIVQLLRPLVWKYSTSFVKLYLQYLEYQPQVYGFDGFRMSTTTILPN